jgi:hypothetical protein
VCSTLGTLQELFDIVCIQASAHENDGLVHLVGLDDALESQGFEALDGFRVHLCRALCESMRSSCMHAHTRTHTHTHTQRISSNRYEQTCSATLAHLPLCIPSVGTVADRQELSLAGSQITIAWCTHFRHDGCWVHPPSESGEHMLLARETWRHSVQRAHDVPRAQSPFL